MTCVELGNHSAKRKAKLPLFASLGRPLATGSAVRSRAGQPPRQKTDRREVISIGKHKGLSSEPIESSLIVFKVTVSKRNSPGKSQRSQLVARFNQC